jgi:hypothetical protein
MTNGDGRKPEGAPERSPKAGAGAPSGVDGNGPKRFSVQRKMAIVARLLRGEPPATASGLRRFFLCTCGSSTGNLPHQAIGGRRPSLDSRGFPFKRGPLWQSCRAWAHASPRAGRSTKPYQHRYGCLRHGTTDVSCPGKRQDQIYLRSELRLTAGHVTDRPLH